MATIRDLWNKGRKGLRWKHWKQRRLKISAQRRRLDKTMPKARGTKANYRIDNYYKLKEKSEQRRDENRCR
jgi:hypothetical protein